MERRNNRNRSDGSKALVWGALALGAGVLLYKWLKSDEKNENTNSADDDSMLFENAKAIDIPRELGLTDEEYITVINLIEAEYLCSISFDLLYDPYTLRCGHTFNNDCIKDWMKTRNDCPKCRKTINPQYIVKNYTLKRIVERRARDILKK